MHSARLKECNTAMSRPVLHHVDSGGHEDYPGKYQIIKKKPLLYPNAETVVPCKPLAALVTLVSLGVRVVRGTDTYLKA